MNRGDLFTNWQNSEFFMILATSPDDVRRQDDYAFRYDRSMRRWTRRRVGPGADHRDFSRFVLAWCPSYGGAGWIRRSVLRP